MANHHLVRGTERLAQIREDAHRIARELASRLAQQPAPISVRPDDTTQG